MMKLARPLLAATALTAAAILPATAADISYDPPVIDYEPPVMAAPHNDAFGGWYIRGDVGYHNSRMRGGHWITPGPGENSFVTAKLSDGWSVGGGVGYQVTNYLRTDLTLDYFNKVSFRGSTRGACGVDPNCVSTDVSSMSALSLLANAYVELGTWHKITPYIGAGIGGTRVNWSTLANTACEEADPSNCDPTEFHAGKKGWRFTYALMAGASYCLTNSLKLDAGYRFRHVNSGGMFGVGGVTGPGFDKGFNVHEVRGGLRYHIGGDPRCGEEQIVYIPPEPYEPPVYK